MLKEFAVCLLMSVMLCNHSKKPVYTKVTFLYDIKRGELSSSKRTFQYYLSFFEQLLRTDANLIVFGNKQLEEFVWRRREQHNTVFVHKELSQFQNYWFSNLVEKARQGILQQPNFRQQNYPQYSIKQYNLLMFGKLYAMTEAVKYDKWNTDFLIWTDGGFMHQFPKSAVFPENLVKKFYQLLQPQWVFVTYNYKSDLFFGFKGRENTYIQRTTKHYQDVLASTMGGNIHILRDIKSAFENIARITLQNGDLNSDQSILSLMPIKYPFLIPIVSDIYLGHFFNKFHIYEDVSRAPMYARFFQKKMVAEGNSSIIHTSISTMKDQNIMNKSLNESSSKQMKREQSAKSGLKQKQLTRLFYSRKKSADRTILYTKFSFFTLLVAAYIFFLMKNKQLKAACLKNTSEARES